jgi:hypothetical protein
MERVETYLYISEETKGYAAANIIDLARQQMDLKIEKEHGSGWVLESENDERNLPGYRFMGPSYPGMFRLTRLYRKHKNSDQRGR